MKKILAVIVLSLFVVVAQFTLTVISVSGTTQDEISGEKIKAKIVIKDLDGKIANRTNSTGNYFATGLKPGKNYKMEISADGYFMKSYDLNIPNSDKYEEISRDFTLKPMQVGVKIPVKVIPFDKGKTKIRDGADYIFKDLVQIMRRSRQGSFEIEVYPEGNSTPAEMKELSTERANALKTYFESNRIRSTLTVNPHGTTDPNNPPPSEKQSKGKRYKGSIYITVKAV